MKMRLAVAKSFRGKIQGAGVIAKNARVVAVEGYESVRVEVNPDPALGDEASRSEATLRPLVHAALNSEEWQERSRVLARRWAGGHELRMSKVNSLVVTFSSCSRRRLAEPTNSSMVSLGAPFFALLP